MATASDRAVSVASEDEEDFVDAQEEIAPTNDERDDDESSVTETGVGREFRGEDMDLDGEEAGPEEMEVDLFESTFGQTKAEESCVEDEIATISTRFVAAEHTKGCTSIRGPPTPTPDSSNFDTASAQALERCDHPPPNPIKDRSWALRRLTRFHDRAKDLIPRLPLPAHRYWIGVLHMGKNPDIFKVEKDFLWLKGNRFSTVQTIWHMYQQSTAVDKFVLLLGHETVDFDDTVEDLDYFNEKTVILRAVKEGHPDAKGRDLTAGIVKFQAQPPKKKVHEEVIVLDDD